MKAGIILGSTRQGRTGEPIARWALECARAEWKDGEVTLLDLAEFPMPFVDSAIPPGGLQGKYPHQAVQNWAHVIAQLDAFIFVTPEYNHGYPAVLKNAIDWLWDEWKGKPAGIVSYSSGPIGGARGAEQLKLVLSYVGLRVTPNHVHIGMAHGEMPEAAQDFAGKALVGTLAEMQALQSAAH